MTTLRTDSTHSGITIDYANGSGFVHGGSGPLTVYSDDEKAAINALTDADNDTYYLFLVNSVTKLDADGNNTVVSGYMPVGYQHGFIFEQFDVARTFAHELSHGAFALHHTFSANTESFRADEGTTNNLMDYTEHGIALNHKQWTWMHENHGKGLFGFLADESEGEALQTPGLQVLIDRIKNANLKNENYIQFNDYKTGNVVKSIVYLQQTVKLLTDEIQLGAALHVFSKDELNKLVTNSHENVDYRTSGVVSKVSGGFTYRVDFKYFDIKSVLNERNYQNPEIALEFFFKKEDYEKFRKYISGESTLESWKDYVVCTSDANIREKESPYGIIKPQEFLTKGKVVELISHLTTGDAARALVRYKDDKEEYCTSTSNLMQIIPIEDEQQYKLRKDLSPFALPYSDETKNEVKTTEILYVTHNCGEYKCINKKDGDEYEFLGWVKKNDLAKNIIDTEFIEKYLTATKDAVSVITASTAGEIGKAACNLCVRAALYNLTGDTVLFPQSGSAVVITEGEQIYGKVRGDGSAQSIINDLNDPNSELNKYFDEIDSPQKKSPPEIYAAFWDTIQYMVDYKKEIVIGTYDPGHVFMVVPGGLYEVVDNSDRENKWTNNEYNVDLGDKWGASFKREGFSYVLRIMDCGRGVKYYNGPVYGVMDAKPLIGKRDDRIVKFYKYKQK